MSIALRRSDEFQKNHPANRERGVERHALRRKERNHATFLGTHDYKPDAKVAFANHPISEIA